MNSKYIMWFCVSCLNKKNISNDVIETNKKVKNEIFRKNYHTNWVNEIRYYKP